MAKHAIDFSNVKESSGINPKRMPEGDYLVKIVKYDETDKDGDAMWNFHMQLEDSKSAVYPYYCKLVENQLWKLRNLLIAAGFTVPKKRINIDPEKLIGKVIGVTLADDEYEGKLKSVVDATFPASELDAHEPEDDDVEEDDEDEVVEPVKKKKGKKEPEPEPVKKGKKAAPEPPAKKGKKKAAEDDDELDIDDL